MSTHPDIPDAEVDRLFAGQPASAEEFASVAEFVRALDCGCRTPETSQLEAAHVSAMLAAAQTMPAEAPAASVPARVSWVAAIRTHKWLTAATVSLAALLAYGGAAYAGVLPVPIQAETATLARDVGITLPMPKLESLSPLGPQGNSAEHRNNPSGTDNGNHLGQIKRASAVTALHTTETTGTAASEATGTVAGSSETSESAGTHGKKHLRRAVLAAGVVAHANGAGSATDGKTGSKAKGKGKAKRKGKAKHKARRSSTKSSARRSKRSSKTEQGTGSSGDGPRHRRSSASSA
jgi:hypothetical protein